MTPDEPSETAAGDPGEEAGVFGNLPKTRPGARSPRRDAAAAKSAKPKRAPAKPRPAATDPPPPPPRSAPAEPEPASDRERSGIEEAAWAGVAAAAEAATIGVRLANRALEAMRDAVDRR